MDDDFSAQLPSEFDEPEQAANPNSEERSSAQPLANGAMLSPVPKAPAPTSPIRPSNPEPPKPKLSPSIGRPPKPIHPTGEAPALSPNNLNLEDEPLNKVEVTLENLRQKMIAVAQEYADGKINKAQFNAIYKRYYEQREITQRLLERNPESSSWQAVTQPGHTSFLRDHFAARIISYALYELSNGAQITLQGKVRLPQAQLQPLFNKLRQFIEQGHRLAPSWRQLKDDNWVLIVAGQHSVSVVIFSSEPAVIQRKRVEEAQNDFERANEKILQRGDYSAESLVFPHRSLFQD